MFSAVFALSSCLGDGEEITYYDDVTISSFSLGTLNCYYHTTSKAGNDSIYKRTLNCSNYKFYIDHAKGEVWNPDSLPMAVDAKKVICTINAKNGGTVYLRSLTSDSINIHNSKDSVDFSKPRTFVVYNNSLTGYKHYTIRVNVHQETGDTCIWTKVTDKEDALGRLTGMKALALNGHVYVFGQEGPTAKIYKTAETDGRIWEEVPTAQPLTAEAYTSTVVFDGMFYTLNNGDVMKSADAMNWQTVATAELRQIVAASTKNLYAISNSGMMMKSTDKGATWVEDEIDDDALLLPYENITYTCAPLKTNVAADNIVLYGTRSAVDYPSDTEGMVWTKIDEYSAGSRSHAWSHVVPAADSKYKAPRLKNFQMANYDNEIIAIGGSSIGTGTTKALDQIYRSGDAGITWKKDTVMVLPTDLKAENDVFTLVADSKQSLWIICGGTGMVQKGRINRVLWKKD